MSFWDNEGLLHVEPNQDSENGILFATEFHLSEKLLGNKLDSAKISIAINRTERIGWFDPLPSGDNQPWCHFSHDNMTALYCLRFLHGYSVQRLPIIEWNNNKDLERINNYWLHPRDILFYLIMKEKKWSYIGIILLGIMSLITCSAKRERTSGKCLWWMRLNILSLHSSNLVRTISKYILTVITKLLQKEHGKNPWIDIFNIYFRNPDHPVRLNIGRLYNG